MYEETRQADPLKSLRVLYPLMIVPGMVLLMAPATIGSVMDHFGFKESVGSLFQVIYFLGGVVGILLITRFMQVHDVRRILLCSVVVVSVSLIATALATVYPVMLAFYIFAGAANGILITLPGIYATRVGGEHSHRAQSILYSFFSFGVMAGPVLLDLIQDHIGWRWAIVIPGLLIIPLAVPLFGSRLVEMPETRPISRSVLKDIVEFDRTVFTGLLIALLLYIAAESAVSMWILPFLEKKFDWVESAHWVLTGLWAALTFGRVICGWLSKRINPFKIAVFLVIAAAAALVVAPFTGSRTGAAMMYVVVGLFYSGIYPFLVGYVAVFPRDLSPTVFSIYVAAGAAAGSLLIFISGVINEFGNPSIGMALIALPILGVLACLFWMRKHLTRVSAGGDMPASDGWEE